MILPDVDRFIDTTPRMMEKVTLPLMVNNETYEMESYKKAFHECLKRNIGRIPVTHPCPINKKISFNDIIGYLTETDFNKRIATFELSAPLKIDELEKEYVIDILGNINTESEKIVIHHLEGFRLVNKKDIEESHITGIYNIVLPLNTHFNTPDINGYIFNKDSFLKSLEKAFEQHNGEIPLLYISSERLKTFAPLDVPMKDTIGYVYRIDTDDYDSQSVYCKIYQNCISRDLKSILVCGSSPFRVGGHFLAKPESNVIIDDKSYTIIKIETIMCFNLIEK